MQLTEPFEIGGVRIPNRVVLAPLAGIGTWFVRLQAKRYGAGLAVSEMVSSFAIHHRNEKTMTELLRIDPRERDGGPVSMQLFGQDPGVMRSAAATVAEAGADLIDLNMGCPVPKVCKTGAGAALLDDPDTAVAVARAAREGSGLPVTVKLRSGRRPGATDGVRPGPPPRRRGGRRGHHLPPALGGGAPQGHARLRPGRPARRLARRTGDPHRRPEQPGGRDRRRGAHRRRRGDARPRLAGEPVAVPSRSSARATRPRRATRSWPSSTGSWTAPSSTSARARAGRWLRTFYPWYVERLALGHERAKPLQRALQQTSSVAEARLALQGVGSVAAAA